MNQFDLYQLRAAPGGAVVDVDVVKRGFSWPGLFFAGIWALTKHLWLHGIVLILILVPLNLTNMYAAEEGPAWLWALTFLAALGVAIGVGQMGNDWRRRRLAQTGFEATGVVEAKNAKEALAVAGTEDVKIAEALAAPKTHGRVSVGGMVVSGFLFLSLIGNIGAMATSEGPFLVSLLLSTAVPAVALLIRSLRPPVGFLRGLAVVFGGMCLGISTRLIELSLLLPRYDEQLTDLIFVVMGVFFLWVGFRSVKEKAPAEQNAGETSLKP